TLGRLGPETLGDPPVVGVGAEAAEEDDDTGGGGGVLSHDAVNGPWSGSIPRPEVLGFPTLRGVPILLPLVGDEPPERADAAPTGESLLAAAAELIADCGVASLTMDALATRAGVGKGTVFRRF